jgi:hypothetical protein
MVWHECKGEFLTSPYEHGSGNVRVNSLQVHMNMGPEMPPCQVTALFYFPTFPLRRLLVLLPSAVRGAQRDGYRQEEGASCQGHTAQSDKVLAIHFSTTTSVVLLLL